jgi:hypothetical protein
MCASAIAVGGLYRVTGAGVQWLPVMTMLHV